MKKFVLLALLLAFSCGDVFAQTPAPDYVLSPNSPFTVAWDSVDQVDGSAVNFRLWLNGQIAKNFSLSELQKVATATPGFYAFSVDIAGLAPGTYVLEISAYNSIGEARSAPLNVTAGNKPGPPKNIKIIIRVP